MMRLPPKPTLLTGCALCALLATIPTAAQAQSFGGTSAVVAGAATVTTTAAGGPGGTPTTDIDVTLAETVINWTVFGGAPGNIIFQPANTYARYNSNNLTDYTVLNRILPVFFSGGPLASTVQFNGTVQSTATVPGIPAQRAGQIWFYSPTGIIAGPSATFNVGSLILTTNDIAFQPNGLAPGSIRDPGGVIHFAGPADSLSSVQVQSGAQLNGQGNFFGGTSAYVALVAPKVVQGGAVSANGNIAYLAAEQADMTITTGLVDFVLTVGTTDPTGIDHTASGNTTGPASTSAADLQRISMVALPKNDVLTMLLAGSVGYAPAALAANEGSSVVLSAGFDDDAPTVLPNERFGNIEIGNATFRNDVTAWATSLIEVEPSVGVTDFQADATLNAAETISLTALSEETITVAGNLVLNAGEPSAGGDVTLLAETSDAIPGGIIDITGDLTIDASSSGILPGLEPPLLDAYGGTVSIQANFDGVISSSRLFADTSAGGLYGGALGGIGQGGTVTIEVTNGGTVSSGLVNLNASATGGGSDNQAGDGTGGVVNILATDGTLDFASVTAAANGTGGAGNINSGDGYSGEVAVRINSGVQNWDDVLVRAHAIAGSPAIGPGLSGSAAVKPDAIELTVDGVGTQFQVINDLELSADSFTGTDGEPGFSGQAGGIFINVGTSAFLDVGGEFQAHANARLDGKVADFSPDSSATQTAGSIDFTIDGGTFTGTSLSLGAGALGLSGVTAAGTATGGIINLSLINGGAASVFGGLNDPLVSLNADGYGSPGPLPSHAFGGEVHVTADGGSLAVGGAFDLTADGRMFPFASLPADGKGFNATGGTVTVDLRNGGYIGSTTTWHASAIGDARIFLDGSPPNGEAIAGDGGNGTGGIVTVTVTDGDISSTGFRLDTSGYGAASAGLDVATAFQSGGGLGGTSQLDVAAGSAIFTTIELLSDGIGGGGGPDVGGSSLAALAGDGTGGNAVLNLFGGDVDATDTALSANGFGGRGMNHTGNGDATDGGVGTGGSITVASSGTWTGYFRSASTLFLTANGTGGVGGLSAGASLTPPTGVNGDGGDGIGGTILVDLVDGSFAFGLTRIEAIGTGGYSGDASSGVPGADGGEGFGGTTRFTLIDNAGPVNPRSIADLYLDSSAFGGFGSTFVQQGAPGGSQLSVQAFDLLSPLDITGTLSIRVDGCCIGGGTGIQALIDGAPLNVGGDILMTAGGPISVNAFQPLTANGLVTISGLMFNSNGLIQSGGAMSVEGLFGLNADLLSSGDTTLLQSPAGPIVVNDLASMGLVTANGQSVEIHSLGALSFADLDATAGAILADTVGDLDLVTADATGTIDLVSSGGSIAATGAVNSGGDFSADGANGVSFNTLVSGGTTLLRAANGVVTVADLTSPGAVDALGQAVNIKSSGSLTFTGLEATAGDLLVLTAGDLTTADVAATGSLYLASTGGSVVSGNVDAGTWSFLRAGAGSATVTSMIAGTDASVTATGGDLTIGDVTAGDELWLSVLGADPARVLTSGNLTSTGLGDDALDGPPPLFGGPGPVGNVIRVRSSGSLDLGNVQSAGRIIVVADQGTMTAVSLDAPEAVLLFGRGDISIVDATTGGKFYVADSAMFLPNLPPAYDPASLDGLTPVPTAGGFASGPISGGTVTVAVAGDIVLADVTSGGTTFLRSTAGAIDIDDLVSAGAVTASARSIAIDSTGALTFADLDATAGALSVQTTGNLNLATTDTTGALTLRSIAGSVTATGATNAGGAVVVTAEGGVTLPSLTSGATTQLASVGGVVGVASLVSPGTVSVTGNAVDITGPGALTLSTAQATNAMRIVTSGNLAFASVDAGGNLTLQSITGSLTATGAVSGGLTSLMAGGDIVLPELLAGPVTAIGRDVAISSSQGLVFDQATATAGDVTITVADDLVASRLGATGAIDVTAGNLFDLSGQAHAPTITIESADIALAGTAEVGRRGFTTDVTLINSDAAHSVVLGDGVVAAELDYTLDRAELARLFADNSIEIRAPADVAVGDFALTFGTTGNIGTGGTLEITSPGEVFIIGDVALTTSGPDDTFLIDPTFVDLDSTTGSIAMLGSAGTPLGQLEIASDSFAVASGNALNQLRTLTDMTAINTLLDTPGGTGQPLRAGTITVTVDNAFYIQNSGTSTAYADRRGFSASGLEINTASATTRIAVNGQILTPGGPVGGLATAPLVRINDVVPAAGGQFNAASTINGCVIGGNCAPVPPPEPELDLPDPPTSEDVDPIPPVDGPGALFVAPLIELAETEPLITPPLVDEPITGVGNDDLWEPPCDPAVEGSTCPKEDGQQ